MQASNIHLHGLQPCSSNLSVDPANSPPRRPRLIPFLLGTRVACSGRAASRAFLPVAHVDQLHNSFAGGKSGQVGMDDVLLPAPPLDPDAALDPVALLNPDAALDPVALLDP